MKKLIARFAVLLTTVLFVLQPFSPLLFVTSAYAQEASPTPSPEVSVSTDGTIEPVAAPTATPTPEPAVTPTPEPTVAPISSPDVSPTPLAETLTTPASFPTITTDKADYSPFDFAVITGSGFVSQTEYSIVITSGTDYTFNSQVTTDESGSFTLTYFLDGTFRPSYTVQAIKDGNVVASVTFSDSAASLDQCGNGPVSSPDPTPCQSGSEWENGNLGASKSHYQEGDSVPYRMTMIGLSLASHTLTIEWDTTKSGKHAEDYLTSYDETVAANPCAGVSGCGSANTFAIPADPQVTGEGITPISGNFTIFGGSISAVSAYSYPNGSGFLGDKSARITITFTATQSNPVLAWGGHIATRTDWGLANSAVNIPGSPYHTRLISLDGSGGNQDRSLSADAVIFPSSITIVKDAAVNGLTSFPYTASPSPLTNFSLVDDGTSANTREFSNITDFKTYTITENNPAGWTLTDLDCAVTSANGGSQSVSGATATINLKEGENVSCTYSNQQQQGTLHIIKTVINDNGGTKTANDFSFQVNGGAVTAFEADGQNDLTVNAGTYNVTEPSLTGYAITYNNCSNVVVPAGGSATCTVTNNDIAPMLTLVKTVVNTHGGIKVAGNFQANIDGGNVSWSVAQIVSAGLHTASEVNSSGYTPSAWSGDCGADGNITLELGENKTCSITNTDQPGTLIVKKVVVNDNGGSKNVEDFSFSVNGSGATVFEVDGENDLTVDAGTYSITEPAVAGYATTYDNCIDIVIPNGGTATCTITNDDIQPKLTVTKIVTNDNGGTKVVSDFPLFVDSASVTSSAQNGFNAGAHTVSETGDAGYAETISGDCALDGSITLNLGDIKSCTITNDDKPGTLTVVKHVINDDGGTADAGDFTMSVTGSVPSPASFGGNELGTNVTINAGSYTVGEAGPSGYAAIMSTDCTGTIANGETKVCSITNDDIAPHIIVIKHVINDDGGNAVAGDFSLHITDTVTGSPTGHIDLIGAETPGVNTQVVAGNFAVSEDSDIGYSVSYSGCTGSIAVGQTKTCTVTNDDIAPKLTLVKTVVNDNGGTKAVSDFPLFINGTPMISGTTVTLSANEQYSASETSDSGYAASAWGGDCDTSGNITLHPGDEKTCTITNDDISPQITVIKHVVNDNGGTATAGAFTMNVTATGVSSPSFAGSEDGTTVTLNAGAYGVSENSMTGYVGNFSTDCSGTIVVGDHKTCTVTNDDVQPQLTLIKHVINDNGGTLSVSDFSLSVNGTGVTSGASTGFNAGAYSASESNISGYTASDWSGDCAANGDVTLNVGDVKTCEITNNDQPATLTIKKVADPKDLQDFSFSGTLGAFLLDDDVGVAPELGEVDQPQSKTFNNISVGSYTVTETEPNEFWTLSSLFCVNTLDGTPFTATTNGTILSVQLGLGNDVTCTFTNHKSSPTRTLGFWQTHTVYTTSVFNAHGLTVGNDGSHKGPIDSINKVFGAFYSSIPKKTAGGNRTNPDKARIVLLQQLVAAKLNCAAFGCDSSVQALITAADNAYIAGNIASMNASTSSLDAFNNSGDTIIIGSAGSATPKDSQALANKAFWDTP